MKSKPNSDSALRNATASGQDNTAGNNYAPSVPISVYRELAAELQATKAMLESMNTQNQQLTRQNQQFRHEIDRVVQSALPLQQIAGAAQTQAVDSTPIASTQATPEAVANMVRSQATRTGQRPARPATVVEPVSHQKTKSAEPAPLSDDLFMEQSEEPHRPETKPAPPKDMGGLWLTITILVIVITAFGAGFLVVRPLIPTNNR